MSLPKGFLLSGIHCGIKRKKFDLGLISSQEKLLACGVFATNKNLSYSVVVSKKNIKNPIKAVLVNSGNANCYSHHTGLKDTEEIVAKLAKHLGVKKANILIASTGIIGKKLPKEKIINSLPKLIKSLGKKEASFARSILTTDTFTKTAKAGVNKATIVGFAKGAGMIFPNMATMLGFILTDAKLPGSALKSIFKQAVDESFNSISVDGCASTNDTVFVLSSGKVALKSKGEIELFSQKLKGVCLSLAKMIIKDGEGATKFVTIKIKGAKNKQEAKTGAFSLANSNLFKCALYGANANWGRIISALGQAGIKVGENIRISSTALTKKNVELTIDLKRGKSSWQVYTCDLTPKYVEINAEYS